MKRCKELKRRRGNKNQIGTVVIQMSEPQILDTTQVDEIERNFLGTQFEQTICNLCATIRRADDVSTTLGESETMHLHENLVMVGEVRRLQTECAAMRKVIDAVKNWRYGLIDKQTHGDVGSIACAYPAIYRLATTFDELEHVIYPKDAHGERTCNNDGHKLTREQP